MPRDPNKRQIGAYIPKEIKAALEKEAALNHRNLSNQIEVIVLEWLEAQKAHRRKKTPKK